MSLHIEHVLRELERLWALCRDATGSALVARMSDLAEFLHGSELLRAAYAEARNRSPGFNPDLCLTHGVHLAWEELQLGLGALANVALEERARCQQASGTDAVVDELGALKALPGGSTQAFLERYRREPRGDWLDMRAINELRVAVQRLFEAAKCRELRGCGLVPICEALLPTFEEQAEQLRATSAFISEIGTFRADNHLRGLREVRAAICFGTLPPLMKQGMLRICEPARSEELRGETAGLVSLVRARLLGAAMGARALVRAKAWLERFERERLLAQIASSGGRRTETLIQAALDSFLFLEGSFPITHCDVGGRTDTLALPDLVVQLHGAEITGQLSEIGPPSTRRHARSPRWVIAALDGPIGVLACAT